MVKGVRYGGSVVRLEGERLMARWVLGVQCTIWWAPKWAPPGTLVHRWAEGAPLGDH